MEFAVWLENTNIEYIYRLCFMIMGRLNGYLKYEELENKWRNKLNKLMLAANDQFSISEYTKGSIESLENLIMADASKHTLSYALTRIPGTIRYVINQLSDDWKLSEFFKDVERVMIVEKQDRVARIYTVLNDIADILDMPPTTNIRSKFDEFKQMTDLQDFWSISNSNILNLEALVDKFEGFNLDSIKKNFDYLWRNYIPRMLANMIMYFHSEVMEAIRGLEGYEL